MGIIIKCDACGKEVHLKGKLRYFSLEKGYAEETAFLPKGWILDEAGDPVCSCISGQEE